jgi:hypothetical protein
MAIQIGKYKRPGVFVEEFDASIITSPQVTNGGVVSLVLGFSRKGPINTPILLQNVRDLENIFGGLDRNLERKGSYFHRTISKLLESNPVFAINLMLTSDTLDQIEYKSVSTRSDATNDVTRLGSYRRFFNTTGFWVRDTETFNNLTKDDAGAAGRLLSFTNLSDRYITIFMFKASNTFGFDRTLLEAYGTAEKVPLYLNPTDYASDYLIDVLVVTGDWTNYSSLAVDNKWSQYFTTDGLKKASVRDFANDRNITLLSFYEGVSLIPYFRNSDGRNIFIENIINNDTDSTGLFCTFDVDKLEKDFPNGMIDIVGNNLVVTNSLVDSEQESVEFLSYKETIAETLSYQNTPLDVADGTQRVVAFGPTISYINDNDVWGGLGSSDRTFFLRDGFINGVKYLTASADFSSTASYTIGFQTKGATSSDVFGSGSVDPTWGPYCVINGQQVFINSGSVSTFTYSITRSEYTTVTATSSYYSVAYIDGSSGDITIKNSAKAATNSLPLVGDNDLVLGYLNFTVGPNGYLQANTPTWTNIGITDNTFKALEFTEGSVSTDDYDITDLGSGSFRMDFPGTTGSSDNGGASGDYDRHRKINIFNQIVGILDSTEKSKAALIVGTATSFSDKWSGSNITVSAIQSSTIGNRSLTIDLGTTSVPQAVLDGNFALYKLDNEFTLGTHGAKTMNTVGDGATGSIGKYSDFYTAFENGQINTGDWLYKNALDDTISKVTFTRWSGYDVIVFSSTTAFSTTLAGNETLRLPDATNSGVFTLLSTTTASLVIDPITATFFTTGSAYKIDIPTTVTDETLYDVTRIEDASEKVYIDLQTDSSGNIDLRFVDSTLDTASVIVVPTTGLDKNDGKLRIRTDISNYKQTVEIEEPAGYTPVANKILVNGARYTEIKVGDFLLADVDETTIESGEMPKKLSRIQRKRTWPTDPTYTEISCDLAIKKIDRRGDKQTLRYVPITEYASTFKGMSLKGFRVREASMPDGTEDRQDAILNLVAKGTSLYGALVNKEAFDFRYLVDAFGLGLTERSKQQLVDIVGERLDSFAILNMPSNKMFRDSTSVNFIDSEGVVQTSFIAKGGDPESNPAFLYTFADGKGVSSAGYFYPYVKVDDNGRPVDVPPSAYVATTYIRKHNSALTTITPWTIAAGVNNGRVTNIAGVEVNFSPTDIENLNGAQINPIVFKRNRGFVIETENTSQTLYKSALSYIHVREVLIELERELSAMLLEFQWRYNTPDIRAEIKLRADSICEKYVNRNGLFNYFNKCDEENNTPTIIDNQIGVLDTYVEPIKGMGIIVNNITILRTGAIQAGGFIQS